MSGDDCPFVRTFLAVPGHLPVLCQSVYVWQVPDINLSFFLYILPGARFRALSTGVHCTLRGAG